jgi:hypothetical protein
MINEKQARILLSECEQWLGTDLIELRKKLRNGHKNTNTKPALWELIVLHATAYSIVSRHNKEKISQDQSISSLGSSRYFSTT